MRNFVTTWTKSQTYKACPRQFWLLYGSKHINGKAEIPFKTNKYMEEGKKKHKLLEVFAREFATPCGPLWQSWWEDFILKVKTNYPNFIIEEKIGVDYAWDTHPLVDYYKPMYTDKPIMLHGAIDLIAMKEPPARSEEAAAIDWKSGKARKPEDIGQLAMYALMLLLRYRKNMRKVTCLYVFLDHKKICTQVWESKDLPFLQAAFSERIVKLSDAFQNNRFDPTPESKRCYFCSAEKHHCNFSKR